MSKSQEALAENGWAKEEVIERPVLILEKQLLDTLELCWYVQQARIRTNSAAPMKVHVLFEGMVHELQVFSERIRSRLDSWRKEPHVFAMKTRAYSRLFSADSLDVHEQLESLLCGYAHYARQTSEAIASLQQLGDLESLELLATVFQAAERCLWFLEIYMEGLAFNTDCSRLPDWPAIGQTSQSLPLDV
ncbi:MAG TPA: hypothetical protein VE422_10375 [Terriglobia bacterium]|nr:hypothetical protein [Terriglobia bacterium]